MPIQKKSKDPREKEKKRIERLQEKVTPPEDTVKRFAVLIGGALVAFIVLLGLVFLLSGEIKYKKTEEGLPYPVKLEVTEKVFFDISIGKPSKRNPPVRIVIGLFGNAQPKTVENFRSLATHERQIGYRGSIFHRIVRGFVIQGGDITKGDGTGGTSIYGPSFDDEDLSIETFRGCVAMANKGPNTNNSQFFITMAPTPHLDGKHVVFGRVLKGWEFLQRLELIRTNQVYRPAVDVIIVNSGIYKEEMQQQQEPVPQE
ncbi:hypothetical protein FDP41_011069 [Naegleria fowleri]|uniref:Peptidyl-prolyl cis-trans isomerase n=1 Tax=Naegleria fowleri TaxID=5763 RepID=A0A6A5C7I7_NAEFO|nr:uncharacterized protein FDP41_011069 [Naegleria fowleri]KAF0983091.1 hypothetical protein FDP41_011069 [Naegleria fowleri]CAG4710223.1 unnamed protein product [Naegleria fowleri]